MISSRTQRKQKSGRLFYRKTILTIVSAFLAGGLFILWQLNYKLTFTLLAVIIFFGTLCIRPEFKRRLPGLNSGSIIVQRLAAVLYLLIAFAIISKVKIIFYRQ